jgi:hypothetical protein
MLLTLNSYRLTSLSIRYLIEGNYYYLNKEPYDWFYYLFRHCLLLIGVITIAD